MANIAKSIATRKAIERFGYVLREKLQGALDVMGGGLRAPVASAFFLVGETLDEERITEHGVVCLIEQVRPAVTLADLSEMGEEHGSEVRLPLKIRIAFEAPASFVPLTINGKPQTRKEWVQYAGHIYCGALIDTIHAHAPENYAVQDVTLESDFSSVAILPGSADEILIGGCVCEFNVLQSVYVPTPQREI